VRNYNTERSFSLHKNRTDVCDSCILFNALINASSGDPERQKSLQSVWNGHKERSQYGYDLVTALRKLAASDPTLVTVIENDYLKTLVYPIVNEEPTFKYRASHLSLHRFGLWDASTGKFHLSYWDSKDGFKVRPSPELFSLLRFLLYCLSLGDLLRFFSSWVIISS